MNVLEDFRDQSSEFWAVVKLVSPMIGYSYRGKRADPSKVRRYTVDEIADALKSRDLKAEEDLLETVAAYSEARAELLESAASPNLMSREEARELFEELRSELKPPEAVLPMNKQKGESATRRTSPASST